LEVDVVLDLLDEVGHAGRDHVTLVQHLGELALEVRAQAVLRGHLALPDLGEHVLHALGPPHEVEHAQVHDLTLRGEHLRPHSTYGPDGSVHPVLQAEYVPARVPGRYVQQAYVQPAQDVRVVKLGVGGADRRLQDSSQVVQVQVAGWFRQV
ncbi:hypothetical protein EGW08_010419, partial [Elysia chlorotica]